MTCIPAILFAFAAGALAGAGLTWCFGKSSSTTKPKSGGGPGEGQEGP